MFFSATNALKGEGLQEGVDWLQGMIRAHMNESKRGSNGGLSSQCSFLYTSVKCTYCVLLTVV